MTSDRNEIQQGDAPRGHKGCIKFSLHYIRWKARKINFFQASQTGLLANQSEGSILKRLKLALNDLGSC